MYNDMTVDELREMARDRGIATAGMNKAALIEALGDHDAEKPDIEDGIENAEAERVEHEQEQGIETANDPAPGTDLGPFPPRSAPVDPNAKMTNAG